jgi:hypothetical protein
MKWKQGETENVINDFASKGNWIWVITDIVNSNLASNTARENGDCNICTSDYN